MKRRALVFALGSGAAAASAVVLRPRTRAAEFLPPIDLQRQVPAEFDDWRVDSSLIPILPDPSVQAKLDQIYTQVLARTYMNGAGLRVMLSIAYGADQGSDATSVHRPEFCYSAQGFVVRFVAEQMLDINGHAIRVRRLLGTLGGRVEPITYWVTLNDRAVLPGVQRKLEQIKLGLAGQIPDGLLFRLSTIGLEQTIGYSVQDKFAAAMQRAMPVAIRARYFGRVDA